MYKFDIREIALMGLFSALAVASGYMLIFVPNVELISATIFVSGYILGASRGAIVGFTAELIYSGFNPMGSGFALPHLLAAQISGMVLTGIGGGLVKRMPGFNSISYKSSPLFGIVGGFFTFIYDSLTTLSFPLAAGFSGAQIIATYIAGLGFSLLHIFSNILIFATLLPLAIRAVRRAFKHGLL
ncbi:MAG: hypothetical protein ACE5QV_00110 [Fidelibacterota bacterium]